jgi:hypothetical protein
VQGPLWARLHAAYALHPALYVHTKLKFFLKNLFKKKLHYKLAVV